MLFPVQFVKEHRRRFGKFGKQGLFHFTYLLFYVKQIQTISVSQKFNTKQ